MSVCCWPTSWLPRGRTVSSSSLIDGLWGEDPPRTAGKSLQNVVLRVRKAFEPERSLLVTEMSGYRLAVEQVMVDAHHFEALAGAGDLREALALWRGAAYAGLEGSPVVAAEARRLEELRASVLEARVAADLESGATVATIAELEGLVGRYPTRERVWSLLMTALYREGRQADALAAYDRARATLSADLGIDPGPELRDLQARVLAQDPSLDARTRTPQLPAPLVPAPGALVGRERELAVLREAWARRPRRPPARRRGARPGRWRRAPAGGGLHRRDRRGRQDRSGTTAPRRCRPAGGAARWPGPPGPRSGRRGADGAERTGLAHRPGRAR